MDIAASPVLLFDGHCNLCNGSIQFILGHERAPVLRFASLDSDFGQQILTKYAASHHIVPDSILVLNGDEILTKSSAALFVSGFLKSPWRFLKYTRYIPRFLRDGVYDIIARSRYRIFGRSDTCMIPTPDLEARFADSSEAVP